MKFSALVKTVFVIYVLFLVTACEKDNNTEPNSLTEIEIVSPAEGSILAGDTQINLSILNDDDLSYVHIMIDGQEITRIEKGIESWDFNPVFYKDGETHTILAVATEKDGDQSQSGVVSFEVDETAVISPVYIKPALNYIYTESENLVIDWEGIQNAVEYTFQLSGDNEFTSILCEDTVSADSADCGVLAKDSYYFRLKAKNTTGKITGWSNTKRVYVGVDDITWMNTYNYGSGPEWANDVTMLPDKSIITAGPSWDSAMEYAKISIVYTDLTGEVIWNKMLGQNFKISYANEAFKSGDYIYIAGGEVPDMWSSEGNMLLIKLDMNGNVIWSKKYGTYDSWIAKAAEGPDGYIYLDCDYEGENSIVKTDTDGNVVYTYTPADADWVCFNFDHLNNLIVMYGRYDILPHIVSLDAEGQVLRDKTFGSINIDYADNIFADATGIYICDSDYLIRKFNYDGSVIYQYSEDAYEFSNMMLAGGSLYAAGYDIYGVAIMKEFSSSLTVNAVHIYRTGMLTNLFVAEDGSSVLCGTDTAELQENSGMLLIRTDKDGNFEGMTSKPAIKGKKLNVKYNRIR
ncbi:MAG TPA: hypothetical protein PLK90_02160 [Clostridiales bacterium]|nr:hypothetical protein [Clostridiales bacterium]HQP69181.1 hypothetical protein [Clostridiales bacterium]